MLRYVTTAITLLLTVICLMTAAYAMQPAPDEDARAGIQPFHPLRTHLPHRAEVSRPAPLFSLDAVDGQEFRTVSLNDYRGRWVVLFFYPGDFTFVCPTEIKGFSRALDQFSAANTAILAASTDSRYSHLAWVKSGALDTLAYPILADFTKQTARAYGVLDEESGTARRGLFIIDPKGIVRHSVIHDDKVGRSVEETLRVLKALQTEELCPLNWKPGDKTIKK